MFNFQLTNVVFILLCLGVSLLTFDSVSSAQIEQYCNATVSVHSFTNETIVKDGFTFDQLGIQIPKTVLSDNCERLRDICYSELEKRVSIICVR